MHKIFVVDDDEATLQLTRRALERASYEVATAANGYEALERLRAVAPDLMVLDVMMPGVDGFEVLSTMKESPALNETPVILLTAKTSDADVLRGWRRGAVEYLTKPVDTAELLDAIRRVLSK